MSDNIDQHKKRTGCGENVLIPFQSISDGLRRIDRIAEDSKSFCPKIRLTNH